MTYTVSSGALNSTPTNHTHTHPFNGSFSGTTQVSRYQKGTTNLDFTEARDSEWQWHQLGHMQVSTLLQTDNHISTPPLSFLQAGCPSYRPTNSVKALKEYSNQPISPITTALVSLLVFEERQVVFDEEPLFGAFRQTTRACLGAGRSGQVSAG